MIKKIFLIVLTSLFILSCSDEPTSPTVPEEENSFQSKDLTVAELEELILGRWEWDHSVIMSRGLPPPDNLATPEKEGYTKQRNFRKDNTVTYFEDNDSVSTYSYKIRKFKVLPTDEGYRTSIQIGETYVADHKFLNPDSMMIGTGSVDGVKDFFYRLKEKIPKLLKV